MTSADSPSEWSRLLRIARGVLEQVSINDWTLGGGTALMLQIEHRESRDIDIFLPDPPHLALLDPDKSDIRFEIGPAGHVSDGSVFRKFAFERIGEIDFIVAGPLTSNPSKKMTIEGTELLLDTVPEIIVKKVHYRGANIRPRDIFDIAAAGEIHAASIASELKKHRAAVQDALSAIGRLNPDFVTSTIRQLAIQPRYEALVRTAAERAREILHAAS